jgi:diacylglycerol kinase (ATP)
LPGKSRLPARAPRSTERKTASRARQFFPGNQPTTGRDRKIPAFFGWTAGGIDLDKLSGTMRAAVILGLGLSPTVIAPFRRNLDDVFLDLPARSGQADAVLIFGGDGTIHRYLSELVKLRLPVLVVPLGSGNDFARALNLRHLRDSLEAWQRFSLGGGKVRTVDLGTVSPQASESSAALPPTYFCCVAGIGLDAEVTRRANRLPRWLRGHGGYLLSVAPLLLRFASFPMTITSPEASGDWTKSSSRPTLLAAFANTPSYGGGIKIAPSARLNDGQLDVCVIGSVNALKRLWLFPAVCFGRHLQTTKVEYFRTERLRLETEPASSLYADGEYVCQTPVELGVAQSALQVIVPG